MIKNCAWGLVLLPAVIGCQPKTTLPPGYQGVVEYEERQLGFEFPGRLESLTVDVGATLAAGHVVASLDDSLERAQKPIRTSEAEAANERLALVKARTRPEEVQAMEARVRAAQALEQQVARNLEREQQLLRSGVTPPAIAEDLQSQLDRAVAQRQELEQSLKLLRRGALRQEIAQAGAQADASQASVEALNERLRHYELRAPLGGTVLRVYARVGETLSSGAPVVAVADTGHPYAEVFVPQAEVPRFSVGGAVAVKVDGLSGALPGKVEWLGKETEFTPRFLFSEQERPNLVIRVRVRVDDPDHLLRSGLPAFVTLKSTGVASNAAGNGRSAP